MSSNAGASCWVTGCARAGAYGWCGFALGCAPATPGRFRRKRGPISPWALVFCAVSGGVCSLSALPTWGNAGVLWRFGLIRPAKPPRSRGPDSRGARGEADAKGRALRGGLASVNRGRGCVQGEPAFRRRLSWTHLRLLLTCVHFRTYLRPLFMYDCNRTSRRHARLMHGNLRAGGGGPLPVDSCR